MGELLRNPHLKLVENVQGNVQAIRGDYDYWHYLCDGTNDRGWGCGYRTLQTIISWCTYNKQVEKPVPSIRQIQEILVAMEDKPKKFLGSKEWIGSVEVGLVIDSYCDIPVKIVHVNSGDELEVIFSKLTDHFQSRGSPLMMGGDHDCSSKGVFGTKEENGEKYLLIIDPHFVRQGVMPTADKLIDEGWIKWVNLKDFMSSSFYNLALPQT